jgi:hypothetical protein
MDGPTIIILLRYVGMGQFRSVIKTTPDQYTIAKLPLLVEYMTNWSTSIIKMVSNVLQTVHWLPKRQIILSGRRQQLI